MRRSDPDLLKLLHFEHDCCALCGRMQFLHLHHVALRSQGGDDVRGNLLMLCRDCHDGYHLRRGEGIGLKLAEYVLANRPDTVAYLTEKLGEGGFTEWLRRHGV